MKEKINLSNKQYDSLKKICLITMPVATCLLSVSAALGWDIGTILATIISACAAAIGEIIQISTDNYNASINPADVEEPEGEVSDSEGE